MDLNIIILSTVSQKDKYHITYMWNLKYDTNEIVYKTETDSQRTDFWLPGVGGDEGEQWTGNLGLVEGNGTPLQYSCLENPMDGGAWWAAVHGVT